MQELLQLSGVLLATLIPVALVGGGFLLIARKLKRSKARRLTASTQELQQLQARVDELEQGQRQLHELAERVDFVERMMATRALPKE